MSKKNSRVTPTEVVFSFWLIFDETGGLRLTRVAPGVSRTERAMAVSATLPRSLWRVPSLAATISVAGDSEGNPNPFTVDLQVATEALQSALGVDIDLRVIQP